MLSLAFIFSYIPEKLNKIFICPHSVTSQYSCKMESRIKFIHQREMIFTELQHMLEKIKEIENQLQQDIRSQVSESYFYQPDP